MAEPKDFGVRDRPHISINAFRETAAYTFPSRKQERKPLWDDYAAHAAALLDQLAIALGGLPAPSMELPPFISMPKQGRFGRPKRSCRRAVGASYFLVNSQGVYHAISFPSRSEERWKIIKG